MILVFRFASGHFVYDIITEQVTDLSRSLLLLCLRCFKLFTTSGTAEKGGDALQTLACFHCADTVRRFPRNHIATQETEVGGVSRCGSCIQQSFDFPNTLSKLRQISAGETDQTQARICVPYAIILRSLWLKLVKLAHPPHCMSASPLSHSFSVAIQPLDYCLETRMVEVLRFDAGLRHGFDQ
jgi:hypothetical protein